MPASLSATDIKRHFSTLGACNVTIQASKVCVSFPDIEGAFQALLQQRFAPLLQVPPEAIGLDFSVEVKLQGAERCRSRSRSPRREERERREERKDESSTMEVIEESGRTTEPPATQETTPKSQEEAKALGDSTKKDAASPGVETNAPVDPTTTASPPTPEPTSSKVSDEGKADRTLTRNKSEERAKIQEERKSAEKETREQVRNPVTDDDDESHFKVVKKNREDGLTEIKCRICGRKLLKKSWISHVKTKTHTSQINREE